MTWLEHIQPYIKLMEWEEHIPYLPHKCWISGQWLWLKPALRGSRVVRRDWDRFTEYVWVDPDTLLLYNLQYN